IDEMAAMRSLSPPSRGGDPVAHTTGSESGRVPEADMLTLRVEHESTLSHLEDIYEAVREITEAAEVLSESSRRMADGASDQTGTVTRTTNTVEALSDRIDRISENAEEAADATEGTRQQAMRGLEQIQGIIEGMDRLRSQVEANARKARRLGERSVEIGSIVELIGEISNRTDMLALNATIESVRAGDHGRGFAVVAEEIRKLAERTAAATREIGTLVEAIQADTHESIRALADEEAQMDQETQRVHEAGSALERINRMAEDSARLVDGISHSANDQVLAARDLVAGMQRISEVSRLILGETTQIRQEIRVLVSRCDRLRALTGARRRVPETTPAADTNGDPGRPPGRNRRPLAIEVTP
ncbi:MAG: hypothetical protein IRY99_06830, partial [Isosphaeraceae bacterium]|nr:hypothetical protein [Isosphaeraceae bacterium]